MTDPEQNPSDELDDSDLEEVSGGFGAFGSAFSSTQGTITGGMA